MRLLISLVLLFSLPATAQVFRCGNRYQSAPCPGGKEVDVKPPVTGGPPDKETVYLCKRYSGQKFWAHLPCSRYPRTMLERQVLVPAELTHKERVSFARAEHKAAEALQAPPVHPRAVVERYPDRGCDFYRRALDRNASAARAVGSGKYMDRLNDQRRDLMTRKRHAGC